MTRAERTEAMLVNLYLVLHWIMSENMPKPPRHIELYLKAIEAHAEALSYPESEAQ